MTFEIHPEADTKTEAVAVALHELAVNRLGFSTGDVLFRANADGTVDGQIGPDAADKDLTASGRGERVLQSNRGGA